VNTSIQPDCDGPSAFVASDFARQYYAHYGLVTPTGPRGSCTQQDPYWNAAGSNPFQTGITESLGEISRPAETVLITDGVLFMTNWPNNAIGFLWGCDAGNAHQGGGNHVFLDGHAKFIKGNSERYEERDVGGCWFKKYYTIDK